MFNEHKGGRYTFLTDMQLFELISAGSNIRLLSDRLSFVIPGLKHLLFSEETKDEAIGLITQYQDEKILFTQVRLPRASLIERSRR